MQDLIHIFREYELCFFIVYFFPPNSVIKILLSSELEVNVFTCMEFPFYSSKKKTSTSSQKILGLGEQLEDLASSTKS